MLTEFGTHQAIQFRIGWELIDKRNDGAADLAQSPSCTGVCDVAHLRVGNVQKLRLILSVRRRLIEQQQEFAVYKHSSCGFVQQTIRNILRDARQETSKFSETFPAL